jgi:hypothetical protein
LLLETHKGIRIDAEIFVAGEFRYDIQCQVVGETGTAYLPEPAVVPFRSVDRASTEIIADATSSSTTRISPCKWDTATHEIALLRCKPMPQQRRGREPITDRNATITTSRQKLND